MHAYTVVFMVLFMAKTMYLKILIISQGMQHFVATLPQSRELYHRHTQTDSRLTASCQTQKSNVHPNSAKRGAQETKEIIAEQSMVEGVTGVCREEDYRQQVCQRVRRRNLQILVSI